MWVITSKCGDEKGDTKYLIHVAATGEYCYVAAKYFQEVLKYDWMGQAYSEAKVIFGSRSSAVRAIKSGRFPDKYRMKAVEIPLYIPSRDGIVIDLINLNHAQYVATGFKGMGPRTVVTQNDVYDIYADRESCFYSIINKFFGKES